MVDDLYLKALLDDPVACSKLVTEQEQGAVSSTLVKLYGTRNWKKKLKAAGDIGCVCGASSPCPIISLPDWHRLPDLGLHPAPTPNAKGAVRCPVCEFVDYQSGFDGYDSDEDETSFNVHAQKMGATSFCVNCNECFA